MRSLTAAPGIVTTVMKNLVRVILMLAQSTAKVNGESGSHALSLVARAVRRQEVTV